MGGGGALELSKHLFRAMKKTHTGCSNKLRGDELQLASLAGSVSKATSF